MKNRANISHQIAMLQSNLAGRGSASAWSLSRSYGLPIERVREYMKILGVKNHDE